jgi:hypothetical protein
VDLNHRPLGYECHHQQNPKTMRGAKSNALFLTAVHRQAACPCVAPIICPSPALSPQRWVPDTIVHRLYHMESKLRNEVSGFLEMCGAGRGNLIPPF